MTSGAHAPIIGTRITSGTAEAAVLKLDDPVSFWGGIGPEGTIIDVHHPQHGATVTGRVLVMRTGRGSSSGTYVLAELIRLGLAPAGIILTEPDGIIATGALVTVVRSGVLTVTGAGFMGDSRADVWAFSDPTLLGDAVVDADGAFTLDVTVDPLFIAVGTHTLQVQAVGVDGFVRSINLAIEVDDDTISAGLLGSDGGIAAVLGSLPPVVLLLLAAVLLATLVLLAPLVSRRRSRTDPAG